MRTLHRSHERQEIEKQRAADEVARLKRSVSTGTSERPKTGVRNTLHLQKPFASDSASMSERKKQMSKLVEMGVVVPEEFRAEMAMAGDWHVVSEAQLEMTSPTKLEPEEKDIPLLAKQKHNSTKGEGPRADDEDVQYRQWGTKTKQYPGWYIAGDNNDIPETILSYTDAEVSIKNEAKDGDDDDPLSACESVVAGTEEVASAAVLFKKRGKKAKR